MCKGQTCVVRCGLADLASLGLFRCTNLSFLKIFLKIFLDPRDTVASFLPSFLVCVSGFLPSPDSDHIFL